LFLLAAGIGTGVVHIWNEYELDDLECLDDDATDSTDTDSNNHSNIYVTICRCGAAYHIDIALLEQGIDIFPCKQCSNVVKIKFEWIPEQEQEQDEEEEEEEKQQQQDDDDEEEVDNKQKGRHDKNNHNNNQTSLSTPD